MHPDACPKVQHFSEFIPETIDFKSLASPEGKSYLVKVLEVLGVDYKFVTTKKPNIAQEQEYIWIRLTRLADDMDIFDFENLVKLDDLFWWGCLPIK